MQRNARLSAVAGLVVAALVLAACGRTMLPQCLQQANTSTGTVGMGQVVIITNHSIYAPGERILATIANHLSTSIVIGNYGFSDRQVADFETSHLLLVLLFSASLYRHETCTHWSVVSHGDYLALSAPGARSLRSAGR